MTDRNQAEVTVVFRFYPFEYSGWPQETTTSDWADRIIRMVILGRAPMPADYTITNIRINESLTQ